MATRKLSGNQRMKAEAECSLLMALGNCLHFIEAGNAELAAIHARAIVRYALMLNPKLR